MNEYARKRPYAPFPALRRPVLTGALLAMVAGCMPDDLAPDVTDVTGLADIGLGDDDFIPAGDQWNDCSTWDCNKNHPVLTTFPIEELNENELPDAHGFRITNFVHNGQSRNIAVENGRIFARDAENQPIPGGGQVNGSLIMVSNGAATWEIKIEDSGRALRYWNSDEVVWAYHLVYRLVTVPEIEVYVDLCNDPPLAGEEPGVPEGYETYAILIDDERYDRTKIAVDLESPSEGWFNIACAGSALAKMVLLHFDPRIPASDDYHTSPAQRTATLKMLTADYTGTGVAFTAPKVDLLWNDVADWHALDPLPSVDEIEAVWTETGARCLNTPRIPGMQANIDAYLATQGKDPLPPCGQADWASGDHWMTYDAP